VAVDKLTKYAHFIPYSNQSTAEHLGHIVLDRLIRYHGLPKVIISDRDKLFTSNYWKTLVGATGIHHKLSTAFHPQTDGQTERVNQTLEQYLRHYVNLAQNNWVSLLPTAQVAVNNMVHDTTGRTPFFANYGKHPNLFMEPRNHPKAQKAIDTVENLRKIHDEIRQNIVRAQETSRKYDKSKPAPQLKKGDKVYLLTKNLKTRRKTKKLDHIKVGPFLIKQVKGPVNYELDLPRDAKVHPVFHISLLEPANPEIPLQTQFQFDAEEQEEYEVERIIDDRRNGDDNEYLVKWKGYSDEENTWEPEENLLNCQKILKEYRKRKDRKSAIPQGGATDRNRR
jgi:hypothetical protein